MRRYIKRCKANGLELPTVVYTDNPDQDTTFFQGLFGKDIKVLKDPFHMLQDIFSTCRKKHSLLFHRDGVGSSGTDTVLRTLLRLIKNGQVGVVAGAVVVVVVVE
jgi:hypothetical protein